MNSQSNSGPAVPRFDALLTAAGNRRDDWQRLHALAQTCSAAAVDGNEAARRKLAGEALELLTSLEPLEHFWAYPGPARVQKLREKLEAEDATGFGDAVKRMARAVLGGTYRRDDSLWGDSLDGESTNGKSRAPVYTRGGGRDRLYFEVLVVGSGTLADQERVRHEMRSLRRPDDPFVYELVFAASFEDAAVAAIFNFDLQAVVIYDGF